MLVQKLNDIRARHEAEDRGFTLIELLVVVVIIGILIAIAIPLYLNYQKGAHDKAAQSDLRAAVSAFEQCYTENNNSYPVASAVTGGAAAGVDMSLSCNGTTETAKASDGTVLTYAPVCTGTVCTSYTLTSSNTGGHSGKTFTYNSANGGAIQ